MAIDYLADLEHHVDSGKPLFGCQSHQGSEWHISSDIEDLRIKAKRTANAKKYAIHIYRILNRMDVGEGDSFLYVKKILEPGPKGEPHLNWAVVDTREAAEMLRDVSQGPSPYFGISIEETVEPTVSV
jgi:hypothetical protein